MRTREAGRRDAVAEARGDRSERERIRRGLVYCLGVFVALRVGLSLVALAGVALLPGLDPVGAPGWPANETTRGWHNVVTAWERFDALWFLGIATEGYAPGNGTAVFFPLYPLAIRAVSFLLGGHPLAAGLLVAHLAAFGSMVALYFLTASELDEPAARRTVLYLAVFPTSFFLLAPYSESLFLLLVLVSLWGARRRRWAVAGIAAALASATRNLGVLLAIPLAVEAVQQAREAGTWRRLARSLPWSVAAGAGALAYLGYWLVRFDDFWAPIFGQARWQREPFFPLGTLVRGTAEAFRYVGQYPGGYHLLDWLIVVPALVGAGWVAVRMRPLYGLYVWTSLLAPLSYIFASRPFMSLPRFLIPLFPILWAAAVWAGRRRGVHEALVAASAAALGITTILFVGWYFWF